MRSSILASICLLALTATALPTTDLDEHEKRGGGYSCMSAADAAKVANNLADLIRLPFNNALAHAALCKTFTDYSDSVNELINAGCSGPQALGSATFASRQAFITGQSGQKPIPFTILNLWHNCNTVFARWRSVAPGKKVQPQQEVTGLWAIETTPNPDSSSNQPFLVETLYAEFNSGAWLYDIGDFTPSCS